MKRPARLLLALVGTLAAGAGAGTRAEPSERLCPASEQAIDAAARGMIARGTPGVAIGVSRGRHVLFARGYGLADIEHGVAVTPETVFSLASVTKQFTAAAILSLIEDGRIGLGDRLSKYVPEMPGADRVTLYQLLVQTAGVHNFTDDQAGLATKGEDRSPARMLAWIARLKPPLLFEPGTRWAYSNSNYVLLGLVAERATGEPLARVYAERVFGPAGLRRTALDSLRDRVPGRALGYRRAPDAPTGFVRADRVSPTMTWAAGGLRTTVLDLLRWSEALYGGRVIDARRLALMTQPGLLADGRDSREGMPEDWRRDLDAQYGMGLAITRTRFGPRLWHAGGIDGFKSWLAHYPRGDVTIAMLGNSESVELDSGAVETAVFAGLDERCGG